MSRVYVYLTRNKQFPDENREVEDHLNTELEQMTSSVDLNQIRPEDGLAALRQLPAPTYALDSLHAVMSTMARNVASVDTGGRPEILNLVSSILLRYVSIVTIFVG